MRTNNLTKFKILSQTIHSFYNSDFFAKKTTFVNT